MNDQVYHQTINSNAFDKDCFFNYLDRFFFTWKKKNVFRISIIIDT